MRILVADDSPMLLKLVKQMLRKIGFAPEDILLAEDGLGAVEILSREDHNIDVILTDLNMPNMDGLALIEKLKADERTKDIPILVMTGEAERAKAEQSVTSGAMEYVFKPFTPRVLKIMLGSVGSGQ